MYNENFSDGAFLLSRDIDETLTANTYHMKVGEMFHKTPCST